eukprot:3363123-Amphidinium_carterae.1
MEAGASMLPVIVVASLEAPQVYPVPGSAGTGGPGLSINGGRGVPLGFIAAAARTRFLSQAMSQRAVARTG